MLIRRARSDEAVGICNVLRRSIAELCSADHYDDPAILQRWLANKRPEIVEGWIGDPDNSLLVAVEGPAVLAVGAIRNDGEITLNYVSPDARFKGVSRALLKQLEITAGDQGNDVCHLTSTFTAHRFYLSCGYEDCGVPQGKFGTSLSMPMLMPMLLAGTA
jgi:GNAT superfamily N-acetyltransferase